jgi:hypothetical protein
MITGLFQILTPRNVFALAFLLITSPLTFSQSINPTSQGGNSQDVSAALNRIEKPGLPTGSQGVLAPTAAGAGTDPLAAPLTPMSDSINDIPLLDSNGIAADGQTTSTEAGFKKWRCAPIGGVGYSYDDNIFITHTNPIGSQILKITGGISFDYGDYREQKGTFLQAKYLGVGSLYAQAPAQNTYNDGYDLAAQYAWNKCWLRLDSKYIYFNGANVQVGTFTKSTLFNNSLHGFYQYSDKTVLDLELQQISNIYPSNLDSYVNQAKFGFNYQTTEKLKLGAEGILGANPAQDSPTRYFETLNGRAEYEITGKFRTKATLGAMASEFSSGGAPLRVTPVFSVEGDYTPSENTAIAAKFYRNFNSSPSYNNQDYLATGGLLTLKQTFHQHWSGSLGVGYENDTYVAIKQGTTANRTDNYFYVRPSVGYKFLKYLEASIYYQRSFNSSTTESYTWNDNQYGFEVKTAF